MTKLTGSCLCGSARYEVDGDIVTTLNCHCDNCRKLTGSVFGTNLFVNEESVRISGELASFEHGSDSGSRLTRMFCPKCGSQVVGKNTAKPGILTVRAGTIDQKDQIAPQANIFCDSAVPSTSIDPEVEQFPGMPG